MGDRKHLTGHEVERLIAAIKGSRNEKRDQLKPEGMTFFVSEQLKPMHRSTVNLALKKYGELANLSVAVHPHMLRHTCGYALADQGADTRLIQDYLGHRNIQHTICYAARNPARLEKLWQ
jgi:type 1 fimbriae regulatory protein FimB